MRFASNYRHIAAWGRMMGSYAAYVRNEQENASRDEAPFDAVYFDSGNDRWVTIGECHEGARERIDACLRHAAANQKKEA